MMKSSRLFKPGLFALMVACIAMALPVIAYSADVACIWNKTDIDCSQQDAPCPSCNLPEYNCTQWTGDYYQGTADVYTLTQVGVGAGAYKLTGADGTTKVCYQRKACTQTTVLDEGCEGGGCVSKAKYNGQYCKKCGVGAVQPNVGSYMVYPVTSTGCGGS